MDSAAYGGKELTCAHLHQRKEQQYTVIPCCAIPPTSHPAWSLTDPTVELATSVGTPLGREKRFKLDAFSL